MLNKPNTAAGERPRSLRFAALVVGTLSLVAGSAVSFAGNESEPFWQQLQLTDGYAPAPSTARKASNKESPFEGMSLTVPAEQANEPARKTGHDGIGHNESFESRDGRVYLPGGMEISAP